MSYFSDTLGWDIMLMGDLGRLVLIVFWVTMMWLLLPRMHTRRVLRESQFLWLYGKRKDADMI